MEKQKKTGRRIRRRWWIGGLAALLLTTLAVAGFEACRYYWGRAVTADAVVLLPSGSGFDALTDSLTASGALCHAGTFRQAALFRRLDTAVRPGRYVLKKGMTYAELINLLKTGQQTPVRVTFNNVRTLGRLAGVVSRRIEADSSALMRALTHDSLVKALGFDRQTVLGMFIPNTYEVYWTVTPEAFLRRMKKEYDRFWTAERTEKLARSGLNREQAVTLASIVYEETKKTSEMPRVAGVYINRLKRGMPLQADPTVKFALGDFSIRRVLFAHLETDSPYNTYKYAGLPPGPICMPSIDAIDAVLDYEEHDYLYFCAKDDLSGAHTFARTLTEHNRNAQAYSRALDRMNIR